MSVDPNRHPYEALNMLTEVKPCLPTNEIDFKTALQEAKVDPKKITAGLKTGAWCSTRARPDDVRVDN